MHWLEFLKFIGLKKANRSYLVDCFSYLTFLETSVLNSPRSRLLDPSTTSAYYGCFKRQRLR